jgi:hypothetical protein
MDWLTVIFGWLVGLLTGLEMFLEKLYFPATNEWYVFIGGVLIIIALIIVSNYGYEYKKAAKEFKKHVDKIADKTDLEKERERTTIDDYESQKRHAHREMIQYLGYSIAIVIIGISLILFKAYVLPVLGFFVLIVFLCWCLYVVGWLAKHIVYVFANLKYK